MEVPQKIKEIPHDPVILLLIFTKKKMKTLGWKYICTPMFITELFTIAKIWKQPKGLLIDEWIKMWSMYTTDLLSYKKEWNFAICNNMVGTTGYYAKWKSQRKINAIWFHLYVWSKTQNKWTNTNRLINTENKLGLQWGGGLEEGKNRWRWLRGINFQL